MKFLQKITVDKKFVRFSVIKNNRNYREWRAVKIANSDVFFLGYRTLYNGYIDYYGNDEGNVFISECTVKAALVVKNRTEGHFYVPVDAMEECK